MQRQRQRQRSMLTVIPDGRYINYCWSQVGFMWDTTKQSSIKYLTIKY